MTKFLVFDESAEDQEPVEDMDPGDGFPEDDEQPGEFVTIRIKAVDAVYFLTILDEITGQLEKQVGRG